MPLRKPSTPPKSTKPKSKALPGKSPPRGKSKGRPAPRKQAPPPPPSLWGSLSPERKTDVIGMALSLSGLLILLSLISSARSALTGGLIGILAQIFGWGLYVLPLALLAVGLWLVLRRVERIPPFSIERVIGLALLYLWLLATLHTLIVPPEPAEQAARDQVAGGYLGGLFGRMLWFGLGPAGAVIALLAWLLIALTMSLDLSIEELFRRLGPLCARLQARLMALRPKPQAAAPPTPDVRSNGFTPLRAHTPPAPAAQARLPAAFAPVAEHAIHWTLPPLSEILDPGSAPAVSQEFIEKRARLIEDTLASFGAPAQVVEISRGPVITQFGVEPLFVETRSGRTRVRVSKIVSLADDLALALAAPRIRIQAPVPGRSYVGIEVPNEEMTPVALRDILESELFQRGRTPLRFALGRDVAGHPLLANLETMPHMLIAGTTGSGKSVCVNAILTCFLLHNTPDDLRLILVDPKRVELTGYNGIPHLLAPVVVEMERVIGALQWMTREMDKRYHQFAQIGARNMQDYNARMSAQGGRRLPYLIVVIDELADLMMIAPDETERTITRLAQLARATGIHIILATQRPSVDVVTGLIKANFSARIAFAVASGVDSRVILDQPGAERLLGRGDMLYQAADAAAPVRLQGVFVSDHEIQRLVEYWRAQAGQYSPYAAPGAPVDASAQGAPLKQAPLWEDMQPLEAKDPLLDEAIDLIRREGRASVSMLQRRLRIGYTRAARLIDAMEDKGIIGPAQSNTQVRAVLDYGPAAPPKEG